MAGTLVVPILEADFTTDLEDMLINYIQSNWILADPAASEIGFRPGLFNYHRPYEVCCMQTVTIPEKKSAVSYKFTTDTPVAMRAKRLTTADEPTKPLAMLSVMETELQRIILQSQMYSIPGIDRIIYDGFDRVYDNTDTYSKAEWASVTRVKMLYQKTKV